MFILAKKLATIEDFTRFDQSKIWSIHQEYFLNVGLRAWKSGEIPYSGISNYNEAFKKARLFIENLKVSDKELTKPIRVLEVGGGYGEFAVNFLQAFQDICEYEDLEYFEDLEYYFTDFSQKTLDEVEAAGKIQDFADKVKYKRFDVLKPPSFLDDEEIKLGYFDLIMANYLLDQLPARVIARTPTGYLEKYQLLEDYEERLTKPQKPRNWVKKIKKRVEFRELDIDADHSIATKELEILKTCFRPVPESTMVYSYAALAAVKNFMTLIKTTGLIICSDFNAAAKAGIDNYEPCYYGNSIAQAVNYDFIFKYFEDSKQKVMLYEDPIRPLHTLVLTHKDFNYALQLGQKYNQVYKQNLFMRMLFKYLVELQFAFWIFFIVIFLYLAWWVYQSISAS